METSGIFKTILARGISRVKSGDPTRQQSDDAVRKGTECAYVFSRPAVWRGTTGRGRSEPTCGLWRFGLVWPYTAVEVLGVAEVSSSTAPAKSLPATIRPMLARLTRRPFDSPDYVFELKWDGMRALAFIDGSSLRLQSRNLQDITPRFPELDQLPNLVKADQTVLDGELVCFDEEGHPSFSRLQQRLRQKASERGPRVHFVAFDLLILKGRSVMDQPLTFRKSLLNDVLETTEIAQPCEFIENDGKAFFDATCEHGLEGIMAKEKSSPYFPGKRSPSWHKVKRIRECEFVIGGYDFGGESKELFGSLLLGLYDSNQQLIFVGHVATGFSRSESKFIHSALQELVVPECPFENPPSVQKFVYWCRPELVCKVQYGEFTVEGKLRYPVYVTLRDDKVPTDCKVDDAPGWPSGLPVG